MRTLRIFVILLFVTSIADAQRKTDKKTGVEKVPLTHEVYDGWKEIPFKSITNDGNFAVFAINPQQGDGKAVFYNLRTNRQDSASRATNISLTFDGRHGVFKISPQFKRVKDLRRQKKKKEDLPKDSLGIYEFATGKLVKVPDVRNYKVPEKAGGWVAYLLEAKKETKDTAKEKKDSVRQEAKPKKVKKNNDTNGYTLVLRKLDDGSETSFDFVKDYVFSKYGHCLLFLSTGNDSTMSPGVYRYDLSDSNLQLLFEGKPKYKYGSLSLSEDGTQVAFVVDTDTTKALKRYPKLYYWKTGNPSADVIADETLLNGAAFNLVNEHFKPFFSKDGTKLYFGINPEPVVQDTTLLPEEIVNVEVWNWQDDYIYPQQNRQLENDRKRSYLTVIHLDTKKIVPLGDKEVPSVELTDEGNATVALGTSDIPYRKMRTWDITAYQDIYTIDVITGERTKVLTKVKGNSLISPKANYVYWFSRPDTSWFCYSIKTRQLSELTRNAPVTFADEDDDHPDYPSPYGVAGWTKNDELLLVYDRYDIWALDPSGQKPPANITQIGREKKLVFRYVRLDPEERFIDPEKELLLSAFDETTKASGYYSLSLKTNKLRKLIMSDHRYQSVTKAKNADRILYTRESFTEFPDVWTAGLDFSSPRKLTEANPQMKKYRWGTVEMVQWTSLDNIPLQGLLYKPEGFDPSKKYPMIVYFYEKNSDNIHNHVVPMPMRSTINYTYYVSNGYLVFVPDIVYKIGYPGESAMNCIMPGVTSLIAKGFVDEKHIGVQGHSWGGYQTAYLITRTNLFAAAEAGAPVVNMVSAYGGIRWGTGLSRMFQYERTQSRIGGTLWETPLRYIENSPIFFADKVTTPLLMMHNDADGAVPWYQGIEFFMALRRLNKPVWMLNYNNQDHGLTQRQDRTDFVIRMSQFFDHYLKNTPMPDWMKKGVPAIEKGINQGYTIR